MRPHRISMLLTNAYDPDRKRCEALAAGKPLITGHFGEIAEVVREADCGIVLPRYSIESLAEALLRLPDSSRRDILPHHAGVCGRTAMNWSNGEDTLQCEFSGLLSPLPGAALCLE